MHLSGLWDDFFMPSIPQLPVTEVDNEPEVQLKNYYNFNYVGEIEVGSNRDKFNCIFDTGSTNFWLYSTLCKGERLSSRSNHAFDPVASDSFRETTVGCSVQFGSGCLEGFFGTDDAWVGGQVLDKQGAMHESINVRNQVIGVMTKEAVLDESFDCICGLAYPSMAQGSKKIGPPLFDNMMQQSLLNENIFAFYMSLCEEEQRSELTFGWADPSRYVGPIVWHPVVHKYFWSLSLDDILVSLIPCLTQKSLTTSPCTFATIGRAR